MVSDVFTALLEEISQGLNLPTLHPDSNQSCLIRTNEGLEIQMELDGAGEFLLMVCTLGTVPPGKYRQDLYRAALQTNGLSPPRYGILAYSREADVLVLCDRFYLKNLRGNRIAEYLPNFMSKAKIWKEAVTAQQIPTVNVPGSSRPVLGLFGLRP